MSDPRPQPDESDLRAVTPGDVPELAEAMARSFYENPAMRWTFRSDEARLERLRNGFTLYFERLWLARGDCYTVDGVAGTAVWMPPGRWQVPVGTQLRLFPGMVRAAGGDFVRLLRFFHLIEGRHPHEEHWYLLLLGVAPEHQGRGFGSHLMQPVLRRCDEEGLPAYLETDTERNVELYRRHGFEVTEEFPLPGGGPPVWLMWREPSPAA